MSKSMKMKLPYCCFRSSVFVVLILGSICQLVRCKHHDVPIAGHNVPDAFNFSAFLERHDKSYGPLESMARARWFFIRTLDIFKANVLYETRKISHYLKQNEYIDLTPDEIRDIFMDTEHDLVPVKEALLSPETPADQFVIEAHHSIPSELDDHLTRASMDDQSQSQSELLPGPGIGFFGTSHQHEDIDPMRFIQELEAHPELAEQMSSIIKIADNSNEADYIEKLKKDASRIPFKHVIEPKNDKFDPSLVATRGFSHRPHTYNEFQANLMMDEFLGYLEPYPEPEPPEPSKDINDDHDRGILSNFIDSVKSVRDMFAITGENELLANREDKAKLETEIDSTQPPKEVVDPTGVDPKKTGGAVYNVDWRPSGCMSRLKDQSKCHACYVFAVLDLIEYFYCREMKESTEFSAQYVIDCGDQTGLRGCKGGKLSNVKQFIDSYGLQVDALYPYTARDQTCPYTETNLQNAFLIRPHIKGWAMYTEIQAWYTWIVKSPIIVGINMPSDFLAYGGGIHSGLDCAQGMVHALLLVGAGVQDGKPFWLLKNSFSEHWGEEGYFKLSRKAPIKCFDSAVVARFSFKETSPEPVDRKRRKTMDSTKIPKKHDLTFYSSA